MMGEPPTHKHVHWTEIHIYRIDGGKIVEHWAEIDMMGLLQQITVLPQLETR
jgi:predicted ester cyclase